MLKNDTNGIQFSMEQFDLGIESSILMALFGANTSAIESSENSGTLYFAGDTLNIFKEFQIGSEFSKFIKNAKATLIDCEKANELLLSALDFLKNENVALEITSSYELTEQYFKFNITNIKRLINFYVI